MKGKMVRFSVLALLLVCLVGGASASNVEILQHPEGDFKLTTSSSYDIEAKTKGFITYLLINVGADSSCDTRIKDSNGNVLAEHLNSCTEVNFSQSDYTRNISAGETVTIEITDGEHYIETSIQKVTGTHFDILSSDYGYGQETHFQYFPNQPPQFNSTSISPDAPLIGESVSYGAEVYDSDGSIDYTNLSLSYGGSTVLSDEQRTGTTSPVWNDVFTPQTGNKWLNATLEVVDDAGAVTTKEINRFLSDDAPSVTITDPGNQTYFKYGVPLDVSVSDSDSEPGEDWSCTVERDGQQVDSFNLKEGTNSSYSSTVESDLGTHSVDVSCSDGSGNTDTASESYTVDSADIVNVGSVSQGYETENRTYELDLKTGDMVNSADINFVYDGTTQRSKSLDSNGVETLTPDFYYEVPLVSSNQTNKNWEINYDLNISDFQSATTSTVTESTSTQTQEIFWSYYIENSDTDPGNGKYIETEDLKHDVKIHTETKKAELDGTTTYNRDSTTDTMSVETNASDYTTLRGVLDVGLADTFNQSSFTTESSVDVSFNSDSRSLATGTDTVEVYKIRITDGNTNLNTEKSLVFDVDYEEEGYDTKTRLTLDLSVWKSKDEKIRRYQFKEDPAQEHSYNIYPSWAEYKIRTLPYPDQKKFDLIQYFNQDTNKVRRSYFFPTTQKISNSTTKVPLKTINETESTPIDFEITNSDGDPAQNVYCRVDRKFGGGDFETVFQIKTGSQGKSQSFAEVNEIYYGFTCYKDGEVRDQFAAQIMQNPMRLQLGGGTVETSLNYFDRFDASCTSNTTQISCDYQSQTEKLEEAKLLVERNEVKQDVTVCSKTSPTATGKLVCTGLNTSANSYDYELTGEYPEASTQGASGFLGTQDRPFPAAGLFMTAILFMLTTAATAFDLRVGIGSGALVFLLTSMIDWIVLNPSQEATLIGVAIIAGVAVSQ